MFLLALLSCLICSKTNKSQLTLDQGLFVLMTWNSVPVVLVRIADYAPVTNTPSTLGGLIQKVLFLSFISALWSSSSPGARLQWLRDQADSIVSFCSSHAKGRGGNMEKSDLLLTAWDGCKISALFSSRWWAGQSFVSVCPGRGNSVVSAVATFLQPERDCFVHPCGHFARF